MYVHVVYSKMTQSCVHVYVHVYLLQICMWYDGRSTLDLSIQNCCGGETMSGMVSRSGHRDPECPHCNPCYDDWVGAVDKTFRIAGAFGLVFSLTQV